MGRVILLLSYGLLEALAGDAVNSGLWRGSDDLVAAPTQNGGGLRADQARATDYDDLHGLPSLRIHKNIFLQFLLLSDWLAANKLIDLVLYNSLQILRYV